MAKIIVNSQEYLKKFTHIKEKEESWREKEVGEKRIKTRIKNKQTKQESNNANKHITENKY